MDVVPNARPKQSEAVTRRILANLVLVGLKGAITTPCAVLGVRGYYQDSMGRKGVNDRDMYDDAMFFISPRVYRPFNANTDPDGGSECPGLASLCEGVWQFSLNIHGKSRPPQKQYTCLEQVLPVTVRREGQTKLDTGMFAIQIHRGGYIHPGSKGCQTIYPEQYDEFIGLSESQMKICGQSRVPYILASYSGGSIT